jgi:DNA-binding response OmpR family regulator
MQRALDADGYEALTAANGRAAFLLVALDLPIDLLITDFGTPLIGGEALIAELARYHRPPPVLFAYGLGPEPGHPQPMLHKSFSLDELCARVRSLLGPPATD